MASARAPGESQSGAGGKNVREKPAKASPRCFAAPFAVHVMQILYQNRGFSFQNKKEEAECTVKRNHSSGV